MILLPKNWPVSPQCCILPSRNISKHSGLHWGLEQSPCMAKIPPSCLCVLHGVAAAVIDSWCCCCCSTESFYHSWVGGWVKRWICACLSPWEPPDRRVPMETWPWFSWTGPVVGAEHSEWEKKLALGSSWKSAPRCMDVCLFLHLRDLENCTKMQNSTEETVFAKSNPHWLAQSGYVFFP